jgi:methyltransferase (TIGR00027 family)
MGAAGSVSSTPQAQAALEKLSQQAQEQLAKLSREAQDDLAGVLTATEEASRTLTALKPATAVALSTVLTPETRAELKPLFSAPAPKSEEHGQVRDGTAMGMAKMRLVGSLMVSEEQRLFTDVYAHHFLPEGEKIRESWLAMGADKLLSLFDGAAPGMRESTALRTRFIDDRIVAAVSELECKQIVILGAGYDMRASRLEVLRGDAVRTFEVDRPAQQQRKLRILAVLGEGLVNAFTPVPVELSNSEANTLTDAAGLGPLSDALTSAGFVRGAPTVVVLEGVTQYIPASASRATLAALSGLCGAGSRLLATYIDERALSADTWGEVLGSGWGKGGAKLSSMLERTAAGGEPWVSGFDCAQFAELLASAGFAAKEDLSAMDLAERYNLAGKGRTLRPENKFEVERFVEAVASLSSGAGQYI